MKGGDVIGWVGGIAVLLCSWYAISLIVGQSTIPNPANVMANLLRSPNFYLVNAIVTARAAALGLILASWIAISVIFGIGILRSAEPIVYPIATFLKAAPTAAFVPVFVSLVGTGPLCKTLTSCLICFFPILIDGLDGIHKTPCQLKLLARACGAPGYKLFFRVELPYCLSGIALGLKTAAPLSVVGAIVGEFVAGGRPSGIGTYIFSHFNNFQPIDTFAGVTVAALLGFLFFGAACLLSWMVARRFALEIQN